MDIIGVKTIHAGNLFNRPDTDFTIAIEGFEISDIKYKDDNHNETDDDNIFITYGLTIYEEDVIKRYYKCETSDNFSSAYFDVDMLHIYVEEKTTIKNYIETCKGSDALVLMAVAMKLSDPDKNYENSDIWRDPLEKYLEFREKVMSPDNKIKAIPV